MSATLNEKERALFEEPNFVHIAPSTRSAIRTSRRSGSPSRTT